MAREHDDDDGVFARRHSQKLNRITPAVLLTTTNVVTTVKVLAEAIFGIRYVPTFHGF